jgi:hypothetical protein
MFDTHIQSGLSRIDVHEHRAPTDASVTLLKEMESAAVDRITKAVRLENNDVKLVLNHYRDPMTDDTVVVYYFMLNNKRINGKVSIPSYIEMVEKVDTLISDVSRCLATELLSSPSNIKVFEEIVK